MWDKVKCRLSYFVEVKVKSKLIGVNAVVQLLFLIRIKHGSFWILPTQNREKKITVFVRFKRESEIIATCIHEISFTNQILKQRLNWRKESTMRRPLRILVGLCWKWVWWSMITQNNSEVLISIHFSSSKTYELLSNSPSISSSALLQMALVSYLRMLWFSMFVLSSKFTNISIDHLSISVLPYLSNDLRFKK